ILVALQHVDAAEALLELRSLQRTFAIGIIFHHGRGEHLTESDGEPFGNGGDVFHNRHEFSLARGRGHPRHRRIGGQSSVIWERERKPPRTRHPELLESYERRQTSY